MAETLAAPAEGQLPTKALVPRKRRSAWLPMAKAPRDGTIILVCESPNGEAYNVMPAAYMNHQATGMLDWWGVWTTSYLPTHLMTKERRDSVEQHRPLGVGWRAIALTPLCWQPLPEVEDVSTLRRRAGALLAHKYKDLAP